MTSAAAVPRHTRRRQHDAMIGLGVGELSESSRDRGAGGARGRLPTHRHGGRLRKRGRGRTRDRRAGCRAEELFIATSWPPKIRVSRLHRAPSRRVSSDSASTTWACNRNWPATEQDKYVDSFGGLMKAKRTEKPARSVSATSTNSISTTSSACRYSPCGQSDRTPPAAQSGRAAPSTLSTASPPRPTARSASATFSATRRSPRSPKRGQEASAGVHSVEPAARQCRNSPFVVSGAVRSNFEVFDFELTNDQGHPQRSQQRHQFHSGPKTYTGPKRSRSRADQKTQAGGRSAARAKRPARPQLTRAGRWTSSSTSFTNSRNAVLPLRRPSTSLTYGVFKTFQRNTCAPRLADGPSTHRSRRIGRRYWRAIARLNRSSGVIRWSWLSSPMSSWTHSISPVKRLPVGP